MQLGGGLDSKITSAVKDSLVPLRAERHIGSIALPQADKNLACRERVDIIAPRSRCGCSSVVEHLLAKEDVASSSLVTRSTFPFRSASLTS